ncbi:metal ABC transporter substrate-binding protein [Demequina aurantiaca]|uniref:metal ABC transporter substrate-binding protein n=1 Tax=Demequina aurantiaca TaxID=676200 RepID=UPI003D359115
MTTPLRPVLLSAALAGTLVLSACTASPEDSDAQDGSQIDVAAAFYPLEFVAAGVAGEHANVQGLTAPGVEPHDLELSPATVREMQDASVVLYLSDFQPAVDDAIAATDVHTLDAAGAVELKDTADHEAEAEDDHDDHDHGTIDPHFWLDPTLLATYATAVGEEFASLDPTNADDYTANAAALAADLTELDATFTEGLAQCERQDIFVTHEAFGYLTGRYGLHQEGLSGIDPDAEPSPARVREIRDLMGAEGATTVFTESLVSANVAEALASDAGVATAVLDPIEGVVGQDDYMSVMNQNLSNLREALACS